MSEIWSSERMKLKFEIQYVNVKHMQHYTVTKMQFIGNLDKWPEWN